MPEPLSHIYLTGNIILIFTSFIITYERVSKLPKACLQSFISNFIIVLEITKISMFLFYYFKKSLIKLQVDQNMLVWDWKAWLSPFL
jgi:hypothetical protein